MITLALLFPILLSAADLPKDAISVTARIEADKLDIGEEYEIVLDVQMKDDWSASESGIPNAILQIEAPPSIQLAGKVLETRKELSRNEFLHAPFERLIKENPTHVKFKLLQKPKENDDLRFNVLAYVHRSGGDDHWFARRRYKMQIKPGARATGVSTERSSWGIGKELQLGDKAVPFDLPRADGTTVSLKRYLGRKNIIVTTYRAFW